MPQKDTSRDYSFDNIRFILIFAVVFAHLLEIAKPSDGIRTIYSVIYSFHMPAFVFLFGYFARCSLKRILFRLAIPYFVFQTLYIIFGKFVLQSGASLQYATPYWLLWFLPVCIFYQFLIPLYDVSKKQKQLAVLVCTLAVSLLAGYIDSIGYFLSLSRFFVFQPWFLLGFYCRKNSFFEKAESKSAKSKNACDIILSIGVLCSVIFLIPNKIPSTLLYGSFSYSTGGTNVFMRFFTYIIAFIWVAYIFIVIKPHLNKKIFLCTEIGQNTLSVFLLHGFIVKAIPEFFPEFSGSVLPMLLLTVLILVLTGNRFAKKCVGYICLSPLESRI